MTPNRWRVLLLGLCLFGVLLTATELFNGATGKFGTSGLRVSSGKEPYLATVDAATPGKPAARAGLRAGDVLDLRPMTPSNRYRLFGIKFTGQSITVYVVPPTGTVRAVVVGSVSFVALAWDVWLGYLGATWMMLFGGLLAVRRPENREARILALLLIGGGLWQNLESTNFISPWASLDALAAVGSWLALVSTALLATYSESFGRPPSRIRRVLVICSYVTACLVAALGILYTFSRWTGALDPSLFTGPWALFVFNGAPLIFPMLCATATAVETRGAERTRFLWAFVPLALVYVSGILFAFSGILFTFGQSANVIGNIGSFVAPIGLTYSLLNRRLLDIGFALNRAAIFSGVSIVLVGTFVLAEWLLSDWMQRSSHSANIAVSGLLALTLGLSIRFVHRKVEDFVDGVMFRKRRSDIEAILKMAREAPYITDPSTLVMRAEHAIGSHADAESVKILLDDGHGRYGSIDENDPALVALRAEHVPVDLHALETSVAGEWAYPMVARGHLSGALVVGQKRSLEAYAPDESAAIARLAQSLASALDVFSLKDKGHDVAGALATLASEIASLRHDLGRNLEPT